MTRVREKENKPAEEGLGGGEGWSLQKPPALFLKV